MVVDLDEFMYARKGYKTIPEYLDTIDNKFKQVSVLWKMFGSNGHIIQPKNIIQNFISRLNYDNYVLINFKYFKSICRSFHLKELDIHSHKIDGSTKVLISENNISENTINNSPLHLNHYAIQSWEWFKNVKMTRGDATRSNNVRNTEYFAKYDVNDIEDNELALKNYQN